MAKSKTKGWLDSYQEGGVESTQAGYTDIPFRYNSAWGGQFQGGGKLTDKDETAFQKFFKTLPTNLRKDSPDYDIRGYWNALGRPSEFDYSQPKEDDGYYHAFSRNPQTGEILKSPQHPTFKMAIEEDRKAGYFPIVTPEGKVKTITGKDFAMGGSIPGSVGFTYARTQSPAPSNGPYAKKTKASAQDGKEVPIDPTTNPTYAQPLDESLQYVNDWMNSPMYKQMLSNSLRGRKRDYENLDRRRKSVLQDGKINYYEESIDPRIGAESNYVGKGKSNMYFNKDADYPDWYNNILHELFHITDAGGLGIPLSDQRLMRKYATHDIKDSPFYESAKATGTLDDLKKFTNYVNAPSETRARINNLRKLMRDQEVYDPFTQSFSKDMFDKYKQLDINEEDKKAGHTIGPDPYQQLRMTYTDEEIEDMMNKVSKNEDSEITPMAQNGQEMSYYQHGLDWKPKSISKNGGWLDKYIPEAQDGREQVEQNFQVSKDFLKDWYTQRAELPQFTDIASARAADIDRFSYGYQPYNYMKKSGSFAYYPGRGGDKVYFTDPNDPNIPPHNPLVAYPEVISHELVHGLARKNPQIEGVDYTPVSIKEFNPVYKDQKNRTAENYGWINVEAPAEVTNEKGKTKLKRLPGAETEGTFAMLRMAEKLDPKKTYTAEDMTAIVEKYKNMSKEYIDDPKNHKDYIIHTMMANYGFDPARLAELQNSIVMNESAQPPMAQKGMFIPGVTDFKPMGNASESTSIVRNTPKGQVSTSTTGATKQQMKEQSDAMMRQTKREEEEKKARIAERKSAVASRDKNKPFTFPTGETKTYDQMNWREKNYVAGKALEQRGRFNEDEESFFDEYLNPFNFIGSTAGAIGTAPLEAKMYDSNLPYVGAIASPLIAGAFGFDPLGGAMKVPSKVAQSMESGVLSNIHKVNPFAGTFAGESKLPNFLQFNKLDDPNAFWRLTKDPKNFGLAEGAYFNKGVPLTKELAETFPKGSRASTHRYSGPKWNPKTGKMDLYDGSDYLFKVGDEKFMEPHLNFPEPHLKFFRQSGNIPEGQSQMFKKDWLQGWKEVPKPDVPFKSEINWGAWNSEIPSNKTLMNEYTAIEKTSKANGSWMKNPDGSPFQGTPEQFVQQNSENFKKAFPQGATTGYRGARFHVDDFANRQRNDYATFLTDSERNAETYAGSDRSSKTYYHPDINTSGEAVDGMYQLGIPNNFPRVKGSADQRSWRLLNWDDKIGAGVEDNFAEDHNNYLKKIFERGELKDYGIEGYDPSKKYLSTDAYANYVKNANNPEAIAEIKNVKDQMGYATDIPSNTVYAVDANRVPLKSLRYNNGMFDMTNPNIYKALVPAVIGAAALQKQKKGGVIKDDRGQWAHPGEITEIGSNRITMQGVPYPVLGISNTGDTQMMFPGEEYKFKGKKVTEYPMAQKGKTLPPIYTEDPRKVKAYNDSSYNARKYPIWKNTHAASTSPGDINMLKQLHPEYFLNKNNQPIGVNVLPLHDIYAFDDPKNRNKIELQKELISPIFDEPVQPYILKKKEPQLDDVGNVQIQNITGARPMPTNISVDERHVGAIPSMPQGNYMVGYFDESNQGVDRGFMTPEERDVFVEGLRKRDLSSVQPSTGNITQYYRLPKKENKKETGGWLNQYK